MSNDSEPRSQTATRKTYLLRWGAIALSLGMVVSTFIAASTWRDVRKPSDKNNIRITGSARKRIVSDLIEWSASIEARAPERTAAYVALKSGTGRAVEFLKAQGIKAEEIQTQSATVMEEFETIREDKVLPGTNVAMREERRVSRGFRAMQVVSVSSADIALVEKASREITSLLEEGISVSSQVPSYYYTRLGELKIEMVGEAAKDARNRAENILRSAGNTGLGRLVYANQGIININPANSTETSSEGNNDTSSYEKDIITIVHAEYKME